MTIQDSWRDKQAAKKGKDWIHEVRTGFNTLTGVLSLLSFRLSLRYSILEVSRRTFHVEDELFDIFYNILDGKMQLMFWKEIRNGNQNKRQESKNKGAMYSLFR